MKAYRSVISGGHLERSRKIDRPVFDYAQTDGRSIQTLLVIIIFPKDKNKIHLHIIKSAEYEY